MNDFYMLLAIAMLSCGIIIDTMNSKNKPKQTGEYAKKMWASEGRNINNIILAEITLSAIVVAFMFYFPVLITFGMMFTTFVLFSALIDDRIISIYHTKLSEEASQ